jgi:hypothetical protein
MTYRQKKQAIINEYYEGEAIDVLSKKYYIKEHIIVKMIELNNYTPIGKDIFNVDLLDCWIAPMKEN